MHFGQFPPLLSVQPAPMTTPTYHPAPTAYTPPSTNPYYNTSPSPASSHPSTAAVYRGSMASPPPVTTQPLRSANSQPFISPQSYSVPGQSTQAYASPWMMGAPTSSQRLDPLDLVLLFLVWYSNVHRYLRSHFEDAHHLHVLECFL